MVQIMIHIQPLTIPYFLNTANGGQRTISIKLKNEGLIQYAFLELLAPKTPSLNKPENPGILPPALIIFPKIMLTIPESNFSIPTIIPNMTSFINANGSSISKAMFNSNGISSIILIIIGNSFITKNIIATNGTI